MKYRIREIRKSKGIPVYKLAEMAGITRASLWRIEMNDMDAKISTLQQIAKALGVGIEELFLNEEG